MFNPSEIDRQNAGEYLNLEASRRQAAEFAKDEEELIELIKAGANPQIPSYNSESSIFNVFFVPERDIVAISAKFADIQGLERNVPPQLVRFAFYRDSTVDKNIPGKPGLFDTQNALIVWLHSDTLTLHQVQEKLTVDFTSFSPKTEYYFNECGNFAKLVAIPGEINDTRSPHHYDYFFGSDVKIVPSEMTPGDFELVGTVLTQMKKGLQQLFSANQPTPSPGGR